MFSIPSAFEIANSTDSKVCVQGGARAIEILPPDGLSHFASGQGFRLVGHGWPKTRATSIGVQHRDAMRLALLSFHVPALVDEPMQQRLGANAKPFSASILIGGDVRAPSERIDLLRVVEAIPRFITKGCSLSDKEVIALRLLFASFCQPLIEIAFILRFIAIEALLERKPRADAALQLIDVTIDAVRGASNMQAVDKDSIVAGLEGLQIESVAGAGHRLVSERLGGSKYHKWSAVRFFRECYKIRNLLLHGSLDVLDRQRVHELAKELGLFVPELITRRYDN